MNKLALLHVSNSYNYGSAMMCINFIDYLSKKGKYGFICDAETENDLNRYKMEVNTPNIEKINSFKESTKSFFIYKIANLFDRINFLVTEIKNHDPSAVIILGGDDLTETYSGASIISELLKIYKLSKNSPTFLVCQNIGPFKSWRRFAAKNMLKKCYIYSRDDLTFDYLKNDLKLNNVHRSGDLAFLELPRQSADNAELITSKYGLKKDDYITLVPSGLVSHYTKDFESYIDSWILTINQLSQIEEIKGKKIVLLSHVLRPEFVDDRRVVNEIIDKMDESDKEKIVSITDELLPSQAREILGNGYFTITGRMHAALSTLQMGKPAIALSYSIKYDGVIGQMMKLPQLIIKSNVDDIWSNKKIVDLIMDRVIYVLNNQSELNNLIKTNLKINTDLVMNALNDIQNKIVSPQTHACTSKM